MRSIIYVSALLGFALALMSSPPAWALWFPPVDDPVIIVPFGVPGTAGVHSGVDVQASPSAEVRSPVSGEVVFAGSVPADGGGTCVAVTVVAEDGSRVSLLPLDGAYVRSGMCVEEGESLGRLAATGDDSSASTHLHIGLRQGGQYVDPTPLLPTMVSAPETSGPPSGDGIAATDPPFSGQHEPTATGYGVGSTGAPAATPEAGALGDSAPCVASSPVTHAVPDITEPVPHGVAAQQMPASSVRSMTVREAALLRESSTPKIAPGDASAACTGGTRGATWAPQRSLLGPTAASMREVAVRSFALAAAVVAFIAALAQARSLVHAR